MAISKTLYPERILESRVQYQDHKPEVWPAALSSNLVRGFQTIIVITRLTKTALEMA